jgi:hypothetical protein
MEPENGTGARLGLIQSKDSFRNRSFLPPSLDPSISNGFFEAATGGSGRSPFGDQGHPTSSATGAVYEGNPSVFEP